ncbi:MAG: hypothetical protein NT150_06705 [Bacteroidetes bacterium]|nr:hypothetical protein [Bacteroidota bacterium]
MKKLLFILFASTMMLTSCSKEYTLNSDLNGSWNMTSCAGYVVTDYAVFKFEKTSADKGKVTMTYKILGTSISSTGTYVLDSDTKITVTPDKQGEDIIVYTVLTHSSSELKVQQVSNSSTYIFAKQ